VERDEENGEEGGYDFGSQESFTMDDMVNLLQLVLGPRTTAQHQRSQGPLMLRHLDEEEPEPQLPGQFPRSASFTFGATSGQATATNNILEDEDVEMTDADQDYQDEDEGEHAIPERLTSPPLITRYVDLEIAFWSKV